MDIYTLIDELGAEKVLDEITKWLDSDTLDEMTKDIAKNYDIEYDEDYERSWGPKNEED